MSREYYKIAIVGKSGSGKTYLAATLNSQTTGFINVEDKPLPFKNKFIYHQRCTTIHQVKTTLKEYAEDPNIELIIFDSFSAYIDLLLGDARKTKKGFDIWNYYNEEIGKILTFIKSIQKEVIVTAHYEWLQDEGGAKEKRIKVKGREWEGLIEKDFTIVLYADSKFNRDTKKPEYFLSLYDEKSSAKCPPNIFDTEDFTIPNDGANLMNGIVNFAT